MSSGNARGRLWKKSWFILSLNSIGLVLLVVIYLANRAGLLADPELAPLLALLVSSGWALIGGVVSLSQLKCFFEGRQSSASGTGLILALLTLPLSIAMSMPAVTANPIEWYLVRHFHYEDIILIACGTVTYAAAAFATGFIIQKLSVGTSARYSVLAVSAIIVLVAVQLLLIQFEISRASDGMRAFGLAARP